MAYRRRRQSISRASCSTFREDHLIIARSSSTSKDFKPQISRVFTFNDVNFRSHLDGDSPSPSSSSSTSSSLFDQAIRGSSAARRRSTLSAHCESAHRESNWQFSHSPPLQDGQTIVENKTAGIISETRKLHIRRKGSGLDAQKHDTNDSSRQQQSQNQADQDIQLNASRDDVAMAMAAKFKLLMREMKTMKADLAFAKERCAQLVEENRVLRECREKGVISPEDDDLIRLQLETLLAEKSRLANENFIYARENRFLQEVVEYHQLTMQDVVYVDEGIEAVTEACSIPLIPPCPPGSAQNFIFLDNSSFPISNTPTPPTAGKDVAPRNIQVPVNEDLNNCQCSTSPSST